MAAQMVLTVTQEQIETVERFAREIRKRLPYADKHFDGRRELIEVLDVTASLAWEGGEWVIYARCVVGGEVLRNLSGGLKSASPGMGPAVL